MKIVKFHPDAENEMIEAAAFYETQQSQLGRRFLAAVQDAINRLVFNPRLYPVIDLDIRRCLTHIFRFRSSFQRTSRQDRHHGGHASASRS